MKNLFMVLMFLFAPPLLADSVNIMDKIISDDPVQEAKNWENDSLRRYKKRVHNPKEDFSIFYGPHTKDHFKPLRYKLLIGSMRKNLDLIAKHQGWRLNWNLETDYDIPASFNITDKTLPELFSEVTKHLPLKSVFYVRNKVILIIPLYDKRESEYGHK